MLIVTSEYCVILRTVTCCFYCLPVVDTVQLNFVFDIILHVMPTSRTIPTGWHVLGLGFCTLDNKVTLTLCEGDAGILCM